jgi:hypothetical protein
MQVNSNNTIKGRFRFIQYKAGTKEVVNVGEWNKNLIVTSANQGINRIIRAMKGDDLSIEITKARIGTGNTAPTEADTDLEAPLAYDIEIANRTEVDAQTILFEFFIPNAFLPDDDYTEFGAYTGSTLFSRALISPTFEKVGNVDVSAEYEFVINNIGS